MNRITLQHNRPLRIAGALRIECVAGIAWLTQTGRAGDVFLRVGDHWDLDRGDTALVEALGTAPGEVELALYPATGLGGMWRRGMRALAGVLSSSHGRLRTLRFDRRRTSLAG